jgi:dephospho-CoA kinase
VKVIGLTGGIGMGKSFVAAAFRRGRVPVHDADRAVHALLGPGGRAVHAVAAAFPGVRTGNRIDRWALGRKVFGNPEALQRLEAILHPAVRESQQDFLKSCRRAGKSLALLDVPLLLETGNAACADTVLVVSAPPEIQAARVLARPGMTPAKLAAIRARQMPDREKRRRADHVIRTGLSRHHTTIQVKRLLACLLPSPSLLSSPSPARSSSMGAGEGRGEGRGPQRRRRKPHHLPRTTAP